MEGRSRSSKAVGQLRPQPAACQEDSNLPDEFVWQLLLQELWKQPDVGVVCKLLCCSNAMAQLVHATCAGRLQVVLLDRRAAASAGLTPHPTSAAAANTNGSSSSGSSSSGSSSSGGGGKQHPSGQVLGRWLAKHTQLLQVLALELGPDDEEGLAAGLQLHQHHAAATASAQRSSTGSTARRATRAASAAAAAAAAALSLPPPQLLPQQGPLSGPGPSLSDLLVQGTASSGRLLQVLAGSSQLTRLQLSLEAAVPVREVRQSLSSLVGLRDLTLDVSYKQQQQQQQQQPGSSFEAARAAARRMAEELLPALQALTQLTALHLQPGCLRGRNCSLLPSSLRALTVDKDTRAPTGSTAASIDLGHLSDLTRLSLTAVSSTGSITSSDVLPCSLQELHGLVAEGLAPVLRLPELRRLDVNWPLIPGDVALLQQLSKLTDLRLTAQHCQLEAAAGLVGQLPLKQLTFDVPGSPVLPNLLSHLASWTQLENLFMMVQPRSVAFTLTAISGTLKKLPALRTLAIACRGDPQRTVGAVTPVEWAAFVQDMAATKSLQTLMLCQVQLGEAAAQLCAVSQLTRLALVRCGVGDTAKAALIEKLGAPCVRVMADPIIE